jgi:hypothetical protein
MNYITNLLTIQNQIRILHWQANSYSEHTVLGTAYSALDILIDRFIEEFSGKYSKIMSKSGFTITLKNATDINIRDFCTKTINYLMDELPLTLKDTDTNLLNIRDEMVGELQKLNYLIDLN